MPTMLASAMEEAIRKFLGEVRDHGGLREIRVTYDDVLVLFADLNQCSSESFARRDAGFQLEFDPVGLSLGWHVIRSPEARVPFPAAMGRRRDTWGCSP
jgi:hypothetical protein